MSDEKILHEGETFDILRKEVGETLSKDDKDYILIQTESHISRKSSQIDMIENQINNKSELIDESNKYIRDWAYSLSILENELKALQRTLKLVKEITVESK